MCCTHMQSVSSGQWIVNRDERREMRDKRLSHGTNTDSTRKRTCSVRVPSAVPSALCGLCVLSWLSNQPELAAKKRKERKRGEINCVMLHSSKAPNPKTQVVRPKTYASPMRSYACSMRSNAVSMHLLWHFYAISIQTSSRFFIKRMRFSAGIWRTATAVKKLDVPRVGMKPR